MPVVSVTAASNHTKKDFEAGASSAKIRVQMRLPLNSQNEWLSRLIRRK
jgi:hypothetical protein